MLLGIFFVIISVVMFRSIAETRVVIMNVERYDPSWFKNAKGEAVQTKEELKAMFDNYRWPTPQDLWISLVAAFGVQMSRNLFHMIMRPVMFTFCKE